MIPSINRHSFRTFSQTIICCALSIFVAGTIFLVFGPAYSQNDVEHVDIFNGNQLHLLSGPEGLRLGLEGYIQYAGTTQHPQAMIGGSERSNYGFRYPVIAGGMTVGYIRTEDTPIETDPTTYQIYGANNQPKTSGYQTFIVEIPPKSAGQRAAAATSAMAKKYPQSRRAVKSGGGKGPGERLPALVNPTTEPPRETTSAGSALSAAREMQKQRGAVPAVDQGPTGKRVLPPLMPQRD